MSKPSKPEPDDPTPSAAPPTCVRCSTSMEQGFVIDAGYLHIGQSRWCPGPAGPVAPDVISEVSRLQLSQFRRIVSFRCPRCGYLESYAPNPS